MANRILRVLLLCLLLVPAFTVYADAAGDQSILLAQVSTALAHQKKVTHPAPACASSPPFQQWLHAHSRARASHAQVNRAQMNRAQMNRAQVNHVQVNHAQVNHVQVNREPRPVPPPIPLTLEQSQQAMLNSAPSPLVSPIPDSGEAFTAMLQQNMPLTPQQVVRLHQQIDVAQRAASIPATIPPKPVSSTLMINLAPGTTPPAVRLAQGYVSSLMFIDSTGAPWPIASFDIGNPKAVNMQWDGKSNILLIQAVSPYSNGDIVVRLVGLSTPVTLELVSGQPVVDYRVDIHIARIGPNTKELPLGTTLPENANQLLLDVLNGVAPAGSKQLTVPGEQGEAWLLGEKIYLRTRLTLLSPGWVGKMVSPDGMQAYELPKTSSLLVSRFGEPVELRIEGF